MLFAKASALLALAATASAHIIMEFPAPFDWEDSSTQQSPLEPADFPCKQPSGAYKPTKQNQWNAGETKGVKLIGGATHGGGSCQFSITTDTKPTKDSQWKVIHSVIGACLGGESNEINMSNDRLDRGNPEIPVTMPADMPAGTYTFAWTWLNKLGNREFYMNCAPITVGSGSAEVSAADVSSVLGGLPDMFVANLPPTSCGTKAFQDFEYPNPGDSVALGAKASPGSDLEGSGCAVMTAMGAGNGQLGTPSQPTGAPASSQAPQPSTTSTASGGVFAPGASSAPTTTKPAATQPTTAQPTTTAAAPPANTGAPSSGCTPCTNDGAVVCIGNNQFGLCNYGCAVAQDLAAGMACANGAITRRGIQFPRAAIYNRHASIAE